uniref:Uncharacterized protein n=1 Tax=Arundo donax TaxID=35708 RepID=A0A0A8YXI3_ARUDO
MRQNPLELKEIALDVCDPSRSTKPIAPIQPRLWSKEKRPIDRRGEEEKRE